MVTTGIQRGGAETVAIFVNNAKVYALIVLELRIIYKNIYM